MVAAAFVSAVIMAASAYAQGSHPIPRKNVPNAWQYTRNYDESKVRAFSLPELMVTSDGKPVTTVRQWERKRRAEILEIIAENGYGYIPTAHVDTEYKVLEQCDTAMGGLATRKQVEITFRRDGVERKALLLIYIPNFRKGRAPCFLHYNYQGNHSTTNDPAVLPSRTSVYARGSQVSRWPYRIMIEAGYAVATAHYCDFFPDNYEMYGESILPLFGYDKVEDIPDNGPRAISSWAWGSMRLMDYLLTDKDIDGSKVILVGHSRLGKTALWTAANDRRFAMVVSSCAGCGGDALYRRNYGEELGLVAYVNPHWFCGNFFKYAPDVDTLPYDSHMLIALAAPLPVYVVSAEEDRPADPKGQLLGMHYASPAWELYGYEGITETELPELNHPIMRRMGFQYREGIHDVTPYDWRNEIAFANKWFYR